MSSCDDTLKLTVAAHRDPKRGHDIDRPSYVSMLRQRTPPGRVQVEARLAWFMAEARVATAWTAP